MEYYPEYWVLLKLSYANETLYKVFGSWEGTFSGPDHWRINSGISSVEEIEDGYIFSGYSGSEYICDKESYGTTVYGGVVLQQTLERAEGRAILLTKEEALEYIKENKEK